MTQPNEAVSPAATAGDPRAAFIDSVLLIDGDNDPHLPPDFVVGPRTLVRVSLRQNAKIPRALERRLGTIPHLAAVTSPRTGANAADFVMSFHTGILHATLPMHLPFTIVTNDKSLTVVTEELMRVGRQAVLWTSHAARGGSRRRGQPAAAADKPAETGAARTSRRRRSRRSPAKVAAPQIAAAASISASPREPAAAGAPSKAAEVAAAYAKRLSRIKDPPSRLKTLINDIANRTSGCDPQLVLEELKRAHGLAIDEAGRVRYSKQA